MNEKLPRHIAIIMDGNGRWAKQRHLPRIAGHKAGVDAVRESVRYCAEKKIEALTLFAFSSENWQRPEMEVSYLMSLFMTMLKLEVKKLHKNNIRLRVMAANYGGRWDICEAVRKIAVEVEQGRVIPNQITPELIEPFLASKDLPEPDLLIRTSGEQRISNFMLWQLAYAEFYFTDVFWPDFNAAEMDKAIAFFRKRERRFGCTSEQLRAEHA